MINHGTYCTEQKKHFNRANERLPLKRLIESAADLIQTMNHWYSMLLFAQMNQGLAL